MQVRQHEGSGTVFVSHSKGGGGVERGGDPCGRPGGTRPTSPSPLSDTFWSWLTRYRSGAETLATALGGSACVSIESCTL